MGALTSSLPESASLTRGDYTSGPEYSEEGCATTDRRVPVRIAGAGTGETPAWVKPTVDSLARIKLLPPNWDSYGAQPVKDDLLNRALGILSRAMGDGSPVPSVVPLSDGGLQMEWHVRDQDLEIVVSADEPPNYFYQARGQDPEEDTLSVSCSRVRSIIESLT